MKRRGCVPAFVPFLGLCVSLIGAVFALGVSSCVAAGANLIDNPGFEMVRDGKPVGWSGRAGEPPVVLHEGGRTGKYCVRFTDKDPKAGVFLDSTHVPARPGGIYTATAWFRTTDKCQPGIYLNFFDDLGTRIHNIFRRAAGPTNGWVQVTVTATAPEDAVSVSTGLYSYTADVGTFDVDDVEMTVTGGGEPGSAGIPAVKPGGKTMVDIGSQLELFVDNYLVDGLSGGAALLLQHPEPREVALHFDKPWEGPFCGYFTVMRDGDTIRLYYRGWADLSKPAVTCMAESKDGIHFTRPDLGLFAFDGSKANNIVWAGGGTHNFTSFKDTNPAAPADQRYKAVAGAGPKGSLVPFASPDGIHWLELQKEPVITDGAFDSQNLAFWDSARKEYVCYLRDFRNGVRDIRRATSQDFIHWTIPEWLDYGAAPAEDLYTNAITPYFRAPELLLGFPCRFVPSRKKVPEHKDEGINDGVLMSSRDGLHFNRWEEAFLRPAPDPLCWTDRNNYIAWGMAPTSDAEISLYWNEHYRYPTHQLRRGTIRIDGFASVHAGIPGGEMITRPLTFAGKQLTVNYATSAIGSLRFELCDPDGKPYDGFAMADSEILYGNEISHVVTWRGGSDLSALAGKSVRLRVRLKDADLYSLRFGE